MTTPSKQALSNPIPKRLRSWQEQPRQQAGPLIVSVFGDTLYPRGGVAAMGSLIQLLAPLQVNERLIRTACFRLVQEDWLQAKAVGNRSNYALSRTGRSRVEEASRHIYAAQPSAWDKQWRSIIVTGNHSPTALEPLRRALYWQGFGQINHQCFIHPSADLSSVMTNLRIGGLGAWEGRLITLVGKPPTGSVLDAPAKVVKTAWYLNELDRNYGHFVGTYEGIERWCKKHKTKACTDEQAFWLRVLLVHDFRRLLLRDPMLPPSLLPARWLGSKARALFKSLYALLLPASERHLDLHLMVAGDVTPSADAQVLKNRTAQAA